MKFQGGRAKSRGGRAERKVADVRDSWHDTRNGIWDAREYGWGWGMLQMYFICAVHVSELSRDDWLRLTAFQSLRDLEKRRLLRAAGR